jgi:16S rRNA (guanine966-N2)-methyltransferase
LRAPRGDAVRPTSERVREAWLNALGPDLHGAVVLDLFAGSGALGLEALSRGASHATFVESDRRVLECLRANIAALDAHGVTTVVATDVLRYIEDLEPYAFDIAMADPPYARGLARQLVERYVQKPFARILSVEYQASETLTLPPGAESRRYGDTTITIISGVDSEEDQS